VRPIIQPNTPHNRHILRRQRTQQLFDLVFFARGFSEQEALAFEDFDLEPALLGESVDVGLVLRDDGLAVLDAAVFGGDVADQALPGGEGGHGGGRGCEGAVVVGEAVGFGVIVEWEWSLKRSSGCISSCQRQPLDSSDDGTFVCCSPKEHVDLEECERRKETKE